MNQLVVKRGGKLNVPGRDGLLVRGKGRVGVSYLLGRLNLRSSAGKARWHPSAVWTDESQRAFSFGLCNNAGKMRRMTWRGRPRARGEPPVGVECDFPWQRKMTSRWSSADLGPGGLGWLGSCWTGIKKKSNKATAIWTSQVRVSKMGMRPSIHFVWCLSSWGAKKAGYTKDWSPVIRSSHRQIINAAIDGQRWLSFYDWKCDFIVSLSVR